MFGTRKSQTPIPLLSELEAAAERRQFRRISMPVFFRAPRLRNLREPVVDVSPSGLRVYSDDPMDVGSSLELELFLPDGEELRAVVKVAWIGALPPGSAALYDVGFEIVDMDPDQRCQLNAMIDTSG